MEFEWDKQKNGDNIHKHGIDFLDAKNIFLDPHYIESLDCRKEYSEIRFRVIGRVSDQVLLVVYTYRDERIRIISARRARKDERQKYYESHP